MLEAASQAVNGPRQDAYGPPHVNHARTARLWQAYLDSLDGRPLIPEDVCWLNILQKTSREIHSRTRDGLVDVAGYTLNIEMIREKHEP